MIDPIQTRDIIEERIFVPLGMNTLWSKYIGTSIDIYGDDVSTSVFDTATTLVVVPANYVNTNQIFFQFGDLEKGNQDLIVRPGTDINIKDKVVYQDMPYMVKALKDYVFGSTSIFIAIRCVEIL
jgi:hypothetical protein